MTYTEWLTQQTTERQDLSLRLMEISRNLGEANRNNDKQATKQLQEELKKIYQDIQKTN